MWKNRVLSALAAAALAPVGMVATSGSASAAPFGSTVVVHGGNQGLTISRGQVRAGTVRFLVDTTNEQGSDVVMFAPAPGKAVDNVLADFNDELSDDPHKAAQGTQELADDARIFGLAGVVKGTPVIVSQQLTAGTYYLFDINPVFGGAPPKLLTLKVGGPAGNPPHHPLSPLPGSALSFLFPGAGFPLPISFPLPGLLPAHATVDLTSDDRFNSPDVLPKAGTITVRNVSDTIHFMDVSPVKPGTTDGDIQQFFDSHDQGAPPFALDGPSIEMGVQSPGRQADISYRLPAGTYVLECFIADDETGMPHAFMGMHKVVTVK